MGRRALPKLSTTVDYTAYHFTRQQLEPWQPQVWFPNALPLEVEVGSGKGLFLRTFGAACPDRNFLGIELAIKYARYAAYRVAQLQLPNVRAAQADGVEVFRTLIPTGSLAAVHVYFPDPWWKARHRKRRVLNEDFAKNIERTLQVGGKLHFWTDVEEYFNSTLELLAAETTLEGPLPVPALEPQHALDYRTHRERRVRLANETVYRAEYRKREPVPATSTIPAT